MGLSETETNFDNLCCFMEWGGNEEGQCKVLSRHLKTEKEKKSLFLWLEISIKQKPFQCFVTLEKKGWVLTEFYLANVTTKTNKKRNKFQRKKSLSC